MGDRVAILRDGRLQQLASPHEVYARPANLFVAGFIGTPPMNTFAAALRDGALTVGDDTLALPADHGPLPQGECVAGVRPEHVTLGTDGRPDGNGGLRATVEFHESLGHERHVHCRLANRDILIARLAASAAVPADGDTVRLTIAPGDLHLFDHHTGERLDAGAA